MEVEIVVLVCSCCGMVYFWDRFMKKCKHCLGDLEERELDEDE